MADEPAHGPHPDGIREGHSPLGNSFLTQKRYPNDAIAAGPPPAAPLPQPPASRVFTRIILPVLIFIAAIGVIAWVVQYLPNRQKAGNDGGGARDDVENTALAPLLQPDPPVSSWERTGRAYVATWNLQPRGQEAKAQDDPKTQPYTPEYEVFTNGKYDAGYYDFTLRNGSKTPVEFGLAEMGCRCSNVKACVLATADEWQRYQKTHGQGDVVKRTANEPRDDFSWKALKKEDRTGLTVPAEGRVVVRLYWDGHKKEPERVSLVAKLWANPANNPRARQLTAVLHATVQYVRPVRFEPERVDIGALPPQGSSDNFSVLCWSPTRDLSVRLDERNPDRRFEFTAPRALTEKECRAEEKRLHARGIVTRIRSAYRVGVKVHETKGGEPLDLGFFQRSIPLVVSGDGEALTVANPSVRGAVRSPDIRLADSLGDQERINLKYFNARNGTKHAAKLWAKPGMELEYVGFSPAIPELKAKLSKATLSKAAKQSAGDWNVWDLLVEVQPDVLPGPLPDDCVLVLRVRGTKRQMRIPVVGTAGAY